MAQIPLGNAGRAVPNSNIALPQTGEAEAQAAVGRAVQGIGQQMGNIAADMQQRENYEAKRLQQEEARKAQAQAEAAKKAQEQNKLNNVNDQLTDAKDEFEAGVREGTIPKDQADKLWNERSRTIIDGAMAGFDDDVKPLVQGQIERLGMRYGNDVRKAVSSRDKQDVTAGIDQTLEYAQRRYKTDPQGAETQAMETLRALGPFSNYTPQQIAAKGQAWREAAQFTKAYEAISASKRDAKGLDAAQQLVASLDSLDPQRRAVLTDRIDNYKRGIEEDRLRAQQRAALEEERRDRKAQQSFDVATKLSMTGTLSAEYRDQLLRDFAGTRYAGAFKQLMAQQDRTGPLAAQSPAVLDQTLQQIDAHIAKNGKSPEMQEQRDLVAKVRDAQIKAIEEDGLSAALQYGKITAIPPLDTSSPQALAGSMKARVDAAERAGAWSGKPVSPMTAREAEQFSSQLKALGPEERAGAVSLMGQALKDQPQQRIALAKQMAKNDRALYHAMALGNTQTSSGQPAARLIFLGEQFLKDEGKKENAIPKEVVKRVSETVGDMLTGSVRDDVIEAASLIQLGKRADGQPATASKSVEIVLGGPVIQHAGRKLPAAPGMTADRFRDELALQSRALAKSGGKVYTTAGEVMNAADFAADLPLSELVPAGLGRYNVRIGMGTVLDATGKPIVIEVK